MSMGRSSEATVVERPGVYRRRYIVETGPGWAAADLEDDYHCFGATVRHDGERVTAVEPRTPRTPWSLCVGATAMLPRLVGMRLTDDPRAVYRHTDGKSQCTHLFESAGLAAAHALRGVSRRQYDVESRVDDVDTPRRTSLSRDGQPLLSWTVKDYVITDPGPFEGQDVRTILSWAESHIADPDLWEAVVLLRRGVWLSTARHVDMDRAPVAGFFTRAVGGCFVYQHGVMDRAVRHRGSGRDFTHDPDAMLAHLRPLPIAAE